MEQNQPAVEPWGPPGRGLALRAVGMLLPATLSGALIRPGLVYPLASFDVSGQWPFYHADASPNEVFQFGATILHDSWYRQGRKACYYISIFPIPYFRAGTGSSSKMNAVLKLKDSQFWESFCRGGRS